MGLFSGLIGAVGGGAYGFFNGPRGEGDIGSAMKYGLIGGLGGYAAPHLIKAGKGIYGAGRKYVNNEIGIARRENNILSSNTIAPQRSLSPSAAALAARGQPIRTNTPYPPLRKRMKQRRRVRGLDESIKSIETNNALNSFRDAVYMSK